MLTITNCTKIPDAGRPAPVSCELVYLLDQADLIGFKMLRSGPLGHRPPPGRQFASGLLIPPQPPRGQRFSASVPAPSLLTLLISRWR